MTKEELKKYVEQQEELYYNIMLSFENSYGKDASATKEIANKWSAYYDILTKLDER